ncbi:unknown [Crocosphaera subtropica ATCC 51142]|uniref:VWFA domain-containing protein n=1 Tax=Crocosphaera subtropica (strain ATCC 51142 / BH68) TaxID=43989 RepID=B1WU46_CROS5|nr:VWA domain-containing protein [Crocosphaera subtropica]ACB52108.1 unknown [Crocosphaera subtropica ATCC 51142]
MKIQLTSALNDSHIDANQSNTQRQVAISLSAVTESSAPQSRSLRDRTLPLNLGLILDHSGSMTGKPIKTVKEAAMRLVDGLGASDRLSVVAFDHRAKVIVPNQPVDDIERVKQAIERLKPEGGTSIDEGMKLGIKEVALGKDDRVSQIFLLTDGENEHGDNERCLKLAQVAAEYNITVNTLGFGNHWNQDVLESIADAVGGTLCYIEQPEQALTEFSRLFTRIQSVGLTNAYLCLEFIPEVRLAEFKPVAQVEPETVELNPQQEGNSYIVRLGDLMTDNPRVILVNLYLSQLSPGNQTIGTVQVRYDDPAISQTALLSEKIPLTVEVQGVYEPKVDSNVQKSILTLAKYRQTQLAEAKLNQGDRQGAATLLQTAAKTALQLGDQNAATVLQSNATQLQAGEELTEAQRKKTRIVSKTVLQSDE